MLYFHSEILQAIIRKVSWHHSILLLSRVCSKKAVLNYASKMHPEETPLEIKNGKIKTRGFLNPALKINKQQEDRALVPYQGTYQNNLAVYLYSLGEMSIHMAYHSQSSYRWSHVRSYSYGVESIPSF